MNDADPCVRGSAEIIASRIRPSAATTPVNDGWMGTQPLRACTPWRLRPAGLAAGGAVGPHRPFPLAFDPPSAGGAASFIIALSGATGAGGSDGGATTPTATGCGTLAASAATVAVARRNSSLTSDAGNLVETSASATDVWARAERVALSQAAKVIEAISGPAREMERIDLVSAMTVLQIRHTVRFRSARPDVHQFPDSDAHGYCDRKQHIIQPVTDDRLAEAPTDRKIMVPVLAIHALVQAE